MLRKRQYHSKPWIWVKSKLCFWKQIQCPHSFHMCYYFLHCIVEVLWSLGYKTQGIQYWKMMKDCNIWPGRDMSFGSLGGEYKSTKESNILTWTIFFETPISDSYQILKEIWRKKKPSDQNLVFSPFFTFKQNLNQSMACLEATDNFTCVKSCIYRQCDFFFSKPCRQEHAIFFNSKIKQ